MPLIKAAERAAASMGSLTQTMPPEAEQVTCCVAVGSVGSVLEDGDGVAPVDNDAVIVLGVDAGAVLKPHAGSLQTTNIPPLHMVPLGVTCAAPTCPPPPSLHVTNIDVHIEAGEPVVATAVSHEA